jgi:signal transduction histidine kinase
MPTTQPPLPSLPAVGAARHPLRTNLLRGATFMFALCLAIALVLSVTGQGSFSGNLVYSLCIGSFCWLIIDGGRHLVAHLRERTRRARGLPADQTVGHPGRAWMIALTLLGMTLGPMAGTQLHALLTGTHARSLWSLDSDGPRLTWLLTLLASAASILTLTLLERLSRARADAEAARRTAAENQLKLLESQLEPHMLFNTLANLRVLIGMDAARAQAMLDHLIAFLRATLQASRSSSHALAAEFERVGDYLALMQVRMGPRLQSRLDLPEALRDLKVPPLLLQPLVENSIKHGLEPKIAGGCIEVRAQADAHMLVLTVRDSGVGLGPGIGDPGGSSFGLQQVRERLHTLYAGRAGLVLQADADGGTLARITLPIEA